jgi:hypothetical protein
MGAPMPAMTGMVHSDAEEVIVYLTFTNTSRRPVRVGPDQVRLMTDTSDTPVRGFGNILGTDEVPPASALQASLRFVIPRDEAHLWLEWRDPGNASWLRFTLGTAQQGPAHADHTPDLTGGLR